MKAHVPLSIDDNDNLCFICEKGTQNPCLNAGCTQQCHVVNKQAVCKCNDSFVLLPDGVRCASM